MTQSLKDGYRLQLLAALAVNLAIYYGLANGITLSKIRVDASAINLSSLLPGGLSVALCGILNSQLTALQKARLIFMRWSNPYPGCRAFSYHVVRDPRIDVRAVQHKWSPLPDDPHEQNALWYRIYQQEQGTHAVEHLNRNWLFARDYACMSILLMITLGALGIFQMPNTLSWCSFTGILAAQFLLARRSAVLHAERLVTTVIAQAASRPG